MKDNKALSSTHSDSDAEFSSSPFCPLVEHEFLSHGLFFMSQGKKSKQKRNRGAARCVFSRLHKHFPGHPRGLVSGLIWADRPQPQRRGVRGHAANRLILYVVLSLRTYRKHDEDRQVQTAVTVRPARASLVDHNR